VLRGTKFGLCRACRCGILSYLAGGTFYFIGATFGNTNGDPTESTGVKMLQQTYKLCIIMSEMVSVTGLIYRDRPMIRILGRRGCSLLPPVPSYSSPSLFSYSSWNSELCLSF